MQNLNSLDSSGRLLCRLCMQRLDLADVSGFKAHLLDTPACFFHFTEAGSPNDDYKCKVCNQDLDSEMDLRIHCITKTSCKLKYIELLIPDKSWKDMVLVDQTKKDELRKQQSILHDNVRQVEDCPAAVAELGNEVSNELSCCNKIFLSPETYRSHKTKFHKEFTGESFSSDVESSHNAHGEVADCPSRGQGENLRRHEEGGTNSTRNTQIRATPAHPSHSRARLRPNRLKNCYSCPACEKQFSSDDVLEKHRASSEKCQLIKKFFDGISCIKCGLQFPEENAKLTHIINTSPCENFLKTAFEKGEFFGSAEFSDSMKSNRSMCYYCTVDDGDVFHHLMFVTPCLKIFEMAILRHKYDVAVESVNSLSPVVEEDQFECDICKKCFRKESALKSHKTKSHSGDGASTRKRVFSDILRSEHIYCFMCKKFLKSVAEVEKHHSNCLSRQLLSRFCYEKAVWEEGAYQCMICTANHSQDQEPHFHCISSLKTHMYTHDKGRSPLLNISFTHTANEPAAGTSSAEANQRPVAGTASAEAKQSNSNEGQKRVRFTL